MGVKEIETNSENTPYQVFHRTDAKWENKEMFILINFNHSICRSRELIENYKYEFLGKKIVRNITLQDEAVFVFYEPEEFILELEKIEKKEPAADQQERICPVCQEPTGGGKESKCHCEKEGN